MQNKLDKGLTRRYLSICMRKKTSELQNTISRFFHDRGVAVSFLNGGPYFQLVLEKRAEISIFSVQKDDSPDIFPCNHVSALFLHS